MQFFPHLRRCFGGGKQRALYSSLLFLSLFKTPVLPYTEYMNEQLAPYELEAKKFELEGKLKLKEQWEAQVRALNEAGVLEVLDLSSEGKLDFGIGIGKDYTLDGEDHPMPSYEDLTAGLTLEKIAVLERQAENGLDYLVPISNAVTIEHLAECYKALVLKKYREGKLFGTDSTPLELNEDQPLFVWDQFIGADKEDESGNARLVSYPRMFDKNNHGGKTDEQLIRDGRDWEMRMTADAEIPAEGKGAEQNKMGLIVNFR